MRTNQEVAIDLARKGFKIFPVGADKKPLTKWRDNCTADLNQVQLFWLNNKGALPALPCGENDLFVIDCDCKPGHPNGVSAFEELCRKNNINSENFFTVR